MAIPVCEETKEDSAKQRGAIDDRDEVEGYIYRVAKATCVGSNIKHGAVQPQD